MITCQKCGKEVNTLAKRRHRCKRKASEKIPSFRKQSFLIDPVEQFWSVERCEKAMDQYKSLLKQPQSS